MRCIYRARKFKLKKLSLKINLDFGGVWGWGSKCIAQVRKCIGDTSHVFFIITCTVIYATRNVHFRTLCLFLLCSSHSCRFQFNRQNFCKLRKSRDTRSAASVAADIEGDPLRMALAKELSPPMMWLVAAEVLPLLSETGAVWALNPDPCTDSSLDFQYTVEIVAVHLSLRSPCKKCLCRTLKVRPKVEVWSCVLILVSSGYVLR